MDVIVVISSRLPKREDDYEDDYELRADGAQYGEMSPKSLNLRYAEPFEVNDNADEGST